MNETLSNVHSALQKDFKVSLQFLKKVNKSNRTDKVAEKVQ
jgi:hypothetical protein